MACAKIEFPCDYVIKVIATNHVSLKSSVLEIVSAEGHIAPLPGGYIRTHIHIVAAKGSGEVIGGHCVDATICTSGYLFLQVLVNE